MGCCGNKRAGWLQEIKASSPRKTSEPVDSQETLLRKTQIFEYIGNRTLSIKGVGSGRVYRFNFPGEKNEVAYEDSFAMMAERDLRLCN